MSSSEYVTLKEFGAGSGWHARVLSYAKKRMHIFKRIKEDEVQILAAKLGGIYENLRPYESVKWTISFEPLPNLKILCLLVSDEEFGTDFSIPIMYFTQLLGLSMGLAPKKLGIGTEFIPADKVLTYAKEPA